MTTATQPADATLTALERLEEIEKETAGKVQHSKGCPKNRAELYIVDGPANDPRPRQVARCLECGMHHVAPINVGEAASGYRV